MHGKIGSATFLQCLGSTDHIFFYYALIDYHLNFLCSCCDYNTFMKKVLSQLDGLPLTGFYQTSKKLLPSKAIK